MNFDFKKIFDLPFNFFFRVQLLYNAVLTSSVQQSESALCVHIPPPFWASLPPPSHTLKKLTTAVLKMVSYSDNVSCICAIHEDFYFLYFLFSDFHFFQGELNFHSLRCWILYYVDVKEIPRSVSGMVRDLVKLFSPWNKTVKAKQPKWIISELWPISKATERTENQPR